MKIHSTALLIIASSLTLTAAGRADAASLPAVKAANGNAVPECVTPGRLTAFLAARNASLDDRFSGLATAYMRHGELLGVRWDYAFFQMILETGNMSYKRGNGKPGSVKPSQNNFAGLGATGNGEPGESFKDIDSGVKAHLQHLLMYAGDRVADPVAERTRKVQEWGVLTSWQKGFKRPITFEDLARQWAPGSGGYGRDIESVGSHFYNDFCAKPDPKPHLVQEARTGRGAPAQTAASDTDKPSGTQLARNALDRARTEGDGARAALGAKTPDAQTPDSKVPDTTSSAAASGLKIINETPADQAPAAATVKTAALGTAGKPPSSTTTAAQPKGATTKCRVWTASYGGQKSVIIRSTSDQLTNFTVLDVNEGQEARETDAYIAAYAKGGQKIAEFPSQNTAMEKAFQLCPES